jgi:hypothetical protein
MRGRPTDYKPEYCQMLIDHMAEGFSFESFAGLIGVTRSTIYEWVSAQPEFSDAKQRGFEASRLTWEKIGSTIAKSGTGNATAFIFNMKNRFREDWNDKQTIEHQGAKVNVSIEPDAGCEPIKD